MNVGELVVRAGDRHGDRIALEYRGQQLTFAELADRVRRLAAGIGELGLERGDRVLDLQTNSIDFVITDLGLAAAGMVRVALNYRHRPQDWSRIADDCGARAMIYDARFADQIDVVANGRETVVVGATTEERSLETLLESGDPARPLPDVGPDDLVSLNYSSGTTGAPKGALRSHRNRIASLHNVVFDILGGHGEPDDAWCHAGPMTHASGLFVLPHVVLGLRQVILPEWDPAGFVEAVTARGVTGSVLVPTMIARLLHDESLPDGGLPTLRRLVYAGSPMPPDTIRQAHGRITPELVQMYGLVEAIPPVTVLHPSDHANGLAAGGEHLLKSAGRPCLGVEVAIVDDANTPVPEGEVGEVITRGDHTMAGYWGRDRSGAMKSVVDGWLHTGDLGYLRAGKLYLVDRKGDMIISGGYNIYPTEVEDVIAQIDGVREVAVVGVADPDWGQRVIAVVTTATPLAVDVVASHCRDQLASYKKPKDIFVIDEMPLGATGKISKLKLREMAESGTL